MFMMNSKMSLRSLMTESLLVFDENNIDSDLEFDTLLEVFFTSGYFSIRYPFLCLLLIPLLLICPPFGACQPAHVAESSGIPCYSF